MITFENTEVMNFEGAFRGMRNPLNSWDKSDSCISHSDHDPRAYTGGFYLDIGPNDLKLAQRLIKSGSDHRKFMRQIFVSVDITAPSFWWPEFDTYKVATVRNSCSKMHKIHVKEFSREDFTTEGIDQVYEADMAFRNVLNALENLRKLFNETNDRKYWRALIELLPHAYKMRATVTLNYETLRNIYKSRKNHKLTEWSIDFMRWIDTLPYAEELIKCDI